MKTERRFYGWFDSRRGYLVSRYPPDAPVRPSVAFETAAEANGWAQRKRTALLWLPPLPPGEIDARQS